MIDFTENPIKVKRLISDGISLGRKKVKIKLVIKDWIEGLILILTNVFYFSNSPFNLVRLDFLNDTGIYHHNEDQILYNLKIQKIIAFTKQYNISFLLHLFNWLAVAVNLLKNIKIYKKDGSNMNQTNNKNLFLIRWHQYLGHLKMASPRKYLAFYNIASIDDTDGYVCNSCKKVKAIKRYN